MIDLFHAALYVGLGVILAVPVIVAFWWTVEALRYRSWSKEFDRQQQQDYNQRTEQLATQNANLRT